MDLPTSLSRRRFAQLLGAGVASAALRPALGAPAPRRLASPAVSRPVRLSSNENPYGPSPAAFDAIRDAFGLVWRYPDEAADALGADLAKGLGLPGDHLLLGNGSSEILQICAAAFTGPGKAAVVAEPTFEAVASLAAAGGAEVVRVPLTADHRHDLPRMLAAASAHRAGLVYLCNPNNPTGSITPKGEVRDFLAQVPAGTMVLVDEAYHHYADSAGYESVLPLVRERPDLIVARTFSKIYGMAGLRCGFAAARAETLERLRARQAWDSLNLAALVAARASLGDVAHVERSRRLNREVRETVAGELAVMGCRPIPSQTNFLMVDLGRDAGLVREALRGRGVEVGWGFPALPTHLRVTVGTRPQMEVFLAELERALPL